MNNEAAAIGKNSKGIDDKVLLKDKIVFEEVDSISVADIRNFFESKKTSGRKGFRNLSCSQQKSVKTRQQRSKVSRTSAPPIHSRVQSIKGKLGTKALKRKKVNKHRSVVEFQGEEDNSVSNNSESDSDNYSTPPGTPIRLQEREVNRYEMASQHIASSRTSKGEDVNKKEDVGAEDQENQSVDQDEATSD